MTRVRPRTFLDPGAHSEAPLPRYPYAWRRAARRKAFLLGSLVTGVAVPVMASRGHWLPISRERESRAGAMAASLGIGGLSP